MVEITTITIAKGLFCFLDRVKLLLENYVEKSLSPKHEVPGVWNRKPLRLSQEEHLRLRSGERRAPSPVA